MDFRDCIRRQYVHEEDFRKALREGITCPLSKQWPPCNGCVTHDAHWPCQTCGHFDSCHPNGWTDTPQNPNYKKDEEYIKKYGIYKQDPW